MLCQGRIVLHRRISMILVEAILRVVDVRPLHQLMTCHLQPNTLGFS